MVREAFPVSPIPSLRTSAASCAVLMASGSTRCFSSRVSGISFIIRASSKLAASRSSSAASASHSASRSASLRRRTSASRPPDAEDTAISVPQGTRCSLRVKSAATSISYSKVFTDTVCMFFLALSAPPALLEASFAVQKASWQYAPPLARYALVCSNVRSARAVNFCLPPRALARNVSRLRIFYRYFK